MKRLIILLIVLLGSVTLVNGQQNKGYAVTLPQINEEEVMTVLSEDLSLVNTTLNEVNKVVSDFVIQQVGYGNIAEMKKGVSDVQEIYQEGGRNFYSFIDYYNANPTNFEVLQHGNNNMLQVFGTNSLMNGIKIIQKGNYRSLIIKNK